MPGWSIQYGLDECLLITKSHKNKNRNDDQKDKKWVQPSDGKEDIGYQPSQHEKLPMRNVQNLCNTEDKREPKGGKGIRAALEHSC